MKETPQTEISHNLKHKAPITTNSLVKFTETIFPKHTERLKWLVT